MKRILLALCALSVFAAGLTHAAAPVSRENPSEALNKENPEQGWFFYEKEAEKPEPPLEPMLPPTTKPPPEPPKKEAPCAKAETWTAKCGFVDPGKDFEFQAKQRDALMQEMSLAKNDPKAVENFQYYMKWLLERSIEVANLWQYNVVQNPDLDPSVSAPISTFGLRLMTQVSDANDESLLQALRDEGAFLAYFSRQDCSFCQAITPVLKSLEEETKLDIWNIALDNNCMPEYAGKCRVGKSALQVGQALQVAIVPTLFLYVPGLPKRPETDTWIRIATGVVDATTMKARVISFFTAYRTALLKGVANGFDGRASVDFSDYKPSGTASGLPGTGSALAPTQEQINQLLAQ